MSFQFCWEYKSCGTSCPIRETKVLYCWEHFAEEAEAGLRHCADCAYHLAWSSCDFDAQRFQVNPPYRKSLCRKKTILVVDDEPNILYALEESVSSRGYECVAAYNGETGLTIAKSIRPDLIISDIIMPRLNGYDLCYQVKHDAATSHIPVILVSVRVADKDRLEGSLAGADAYIFKPFSPAQLMKTIEQFI